MRQFKKDQWVWWKDPEGITSGLYRVLDPGEIFEETVEAKEDDRIILIGNLAGSEAQVPPHELESPRLQAVFRRWTDHPKQTLIALFPDVEENTELHTIFAYEPGIGGGLINYQEAIRNSQTATERDCAELLPHLQSAGFNRVEIITHRDYQHEQIMEFASELAEKRWSKKNAVLATELYDEQGTLRQEHQDEYADYYEAAYAQLARMAGYEEKPEQSYICSICGQPTVRCEANVNPNTKEFHDFGNEAFFRAYCTNCEQEVVLIDEKILHRDIDLFHAAFVAAHGAEPRYVHCRIVRTDFEHDSEDDGTEEVDILLGTLPPSDNRKVFCQCDDIAALKALSDGRDRDFALVDCFSMS